MKATLHIVWLEVIGTYKGTFNVFYVIKHCTVGRHLYWACGHTKNICCQKIFGNSFSFEATEMVLASKWGRIELEIQIWWLWSFIQSYLAVPGGAGATKSSAQDGFWPDIAHWTSSPIVHCMDRKGEVTPSSESLCQTRVTCATRFRST